MMLMNAKLKRNFREVFLGWLDDFSRYSLEYEKKTFREFKRMFVSQKILFDFAYMTLKEVHC